MENEKEKEVKQLAKNISIIKCFQASAIYTPDYYEALCLYEFGYRDCAEKIVLTQEQLSEYIKENVKQFAEKLKELSNYTDEDGNFVVNFDNIDETLKEFTNER